MTNRRPSCSTTRKLPICLTMPPSSTPAFWLLVISGFAGSAGIEEPVTTISDSDATASAIAIAGGGGGGGGGDIAASPGAAIAVIGMSRQEYTPRCFAAPRTAFSQSRNSCSLVKRDSVADRSGSSAGSA